MIRAVLDSNILVAGIPSRTGYPARVIIAWEQDLFALITSEHILAEVGAAWQNRYWSARFTHMQIAQAVALLRTEGEVIPLSSAYPEIAPYAQDDPVLATAVEGRADFLVTGDRPLLALASIRDVQFVTARQFLEMLPA